jgi:hypothetical protein
MIASVRSGPAGDVLLKCLLVPLINVAILKKTGSADAAHSRSRRITKRSCTLVEYVRGNGPGDSF